MHLIGIALIIITTAIAIVISIGGGLATSYILETISSKFSQSIQQTLLNPISEIKKELDNLYDDMTWENDEKEIIAINQKITLRENLLKELINKL